MQSIKRSWHSLLLFTILPILCASSLFAQFQGQNDQYDQSDPPGAIARISYLNGGVSLQAAGSDDWDQAPVNYPMVGGDRLYTAGGARAVVQLGGAELRVWQLTDVTLTNQTDNFQQIGLASGYLRLRVFQMDPGSQIEVDTPNGAVIVESPGDYRIEAFPQNGSSIAIVNSGNAQITGPGINQPLSAGYSVGLFGSNPVELQYLDVPDYDDLDYWSSDLDRRLDNSVSARYVSRQMVGYADLDNYGTWNPNSDYGPVWYPRDVPQDWRPYSTGHWAYVQPWGYTWVDDAPWGFAPFHYGRWTQINNRWGWVPGPREVRPVYSPALVAFVGGGPGGGGGISINIGFGGGGGISAWFPIGVGEPYVPWYRCSPRYARQVNVTNVNVTAIRNTTIVNNYNTYINKTVINNTTINNTTVNNTTVNNFNYANRNQVVAVPASAVASGQPIARQAVRLTPQQQQQIARAPISIRPTAPAPVAAHPSLIAATAPVARPAMRPVLMTPTGQARAIPTAGRVQPVAIAKLPPPRVVPQNAPPPPAAPKPMPVNRPAEGSKPVPVAPIAQRPAAPIARPVSQQPTPQQPVVAPSQIQVPAHTPLTTPNRPAPVAPQTPAPVTRPQPVQQPVARPLPQQPAPQQPVQQQVTPRPAPQPVPQPVQRPVPQQPVPQQPTQRPAPQQVAPRPAPQQSTPPQLAPPQQQRPVPQQPVVRPVPQTSAPSAPQPTQRQVPPPVQQRPAPLPQTRPAPIQPAPAPAQQRVTPSPARPQPAQSNNRPAADPKDKPAPRPNDPKPN